MCAAGWHSAGVADDAVPGLPDYGQHAALSHQSDGHPAESTCRVASDAVDEFIKRDQEKTMPPWPGGPCPACGEDMPERMIHCQNCRTLLNTDLEPDSVEIPEFVPLQEIDSMPALPIRGYYVVCPQCTRELRINRKFTDKQVTCKHCSGEFILDLNNGKIEKVGVYVYCPHCSERLRMSCKYIGIKVACKACSGRLTAVES